MKYSARVVTLDSIQAYVGANINMNNANEICNVLAQLGRIAENYDCAILLVGHMNNREAEINLLTVGLARLTFRLRQEAF